MPLQLLNGRLLVVDGALATHDDCCCEQIYECADLTTCLSGTCLHLTISGANGGDVSESLDCEDEGVCTDYGYELAATPSALDGTYTMHWIGGTCYEVNLTTSFDLSNPNNIGLLVCDETLVYCPDQSLNVQRRTYATKITACLGCTDEDGMYLRSVHIDYLTVCRTGSGPWDYCSPYWGVSAPAYFPPVVRLDFCSPYERTNYVEVCVFGEEMTGETQASPLEIYCRLISFGGFGGIEIADVRQLCLSPFTVQYSANVVADCPATPDPPPEPDPPPDPPDPPPDPPDDDCSGLDGCDPGDVEDAELGMFGWSNYDEAFAAGFVYTDLSGQRYFTLENLNLSFILPPDGGAYDYALDLYTPGTYATAVADGILVMYEDFDPGAHDPALTEVYVYKVELGIQCVDGSVTIEYITLHYEVFIGRADGDPGPTSNGTLSATFQGAIITDTPLTGTSHQCRFGPTLSLFQFDGDIFTPTEGDELGFLGYAASESA